MLGKKHAILRVFSEVWKGYIASGHRKTSKTYNGNLPLSEMAQSAPIPISHPTFEKNILTKAHSSCSVTVTLWQCCRNVATILSEHQGKCKRCIVGLGDNVLNIPEDKIMVIQRYF
uniref:Uncharacterized protein n=1 Tax=Anguilla anguilla TaxID=7936 RepID=A0A0E9XLN0_ANGAN